MIGLIRQAPPEVQLRRWLQAEYDRAQEAARLVAGGRGALDQHKHCSAVARMVALGEVMARLPGSAWDNG